MSTLPIHLRNIPLFLSQTLGVGVSNSAPQNVDDLISYSIQYQWSGGSMGFSGTVYIQASNVPVPLVDNDWTTVQQSNLSISGASGNDMINVEKPGYSWLRLVFNITVGSATVTSYYNAKRQ